MLMNYFKNKVKTIRIPLEEYKRLKRLDDKVKWDIRDTKNWIEKILIKNSPEYHEYETHLLYLEKFYE